MNDWKKRTNTEAAVKCQKSMGILPQLPGVELISSTTNCVTNEPNKENKEKDYGIFKHININK